VAAAQFGQNCRMPENELVPTYWRHYELSNSDNRADRLAAAELFWAWEEVDQAAKDGGPGIVDLLVALADTAPDDAARAYLGAGPVEDLIRLHGERLRSEIETAARENQHRGTARRSVW
jgi:hypothetical protein